jgi:hypothetical protein
MFWEEKIDILKKKFSQADFRDPFTDWSDILKKIEAKFILNDDPNYRFVNWSDKIKNKTIIKTVLRPTIYQQIKQLDSNNNYWVVIIDGNSPTSKHLVYDCKTNSLESLLSIISGSFYIIDKKYSWLSYFETDKEKNEVTIIKSGNILTPFDK